MRPQAPCVCNRLRRSIPRPPSPADVIPVRALPAVLRDSGAARWRRTLSQSIKGQPSGWPARAFRTVGRGSHPKDRSAAQDPRSGLTAGADRAWWTRSERSEGLSRRPADRPQPTHTCFRRAETPHESEGRTRILKPSCRRRNMKPASQCRAVVSRRPVGYFNPPRRQRPIRSRMYAVVQVEQSLVQPGLVLAPYHAVHARRCGLLQVEEGAAERVRRDVVQERSQLLLRLSRCSLPYPLNRL